MIGERRGEIQAEIKLLRKNVNALPTSFEKVLDYVSAHLDIFRSAVTSDIGWDEIAQLQTDVIAIMERHNALSNKMDLQVSRVSNRLEIVKQNPDTALTPAPTVHASKGRHKMTKMDTFPLDTNSAFSRESPASDSEKESRISRQASEHRRHLSTYFARKKGP